jgi:molecular chaperone GrpE (heat shock protein)
MIRTPAAFLTEAEVRRVHDASLEILEDVGLLVRNARAREIFAKHGCRVEAGGENVRFPRAVVEQHRAGIPPKFTFRARDPQFDRTVPDHAPVVITGSSAPDMVDPATGIVTWTAERITRTLDAIQAQVQRMGQVESANLRLFDALHAELKGYKDNFLFDALQKPFVRDLITLSDDLGVVQQQIEMRFQSLPDPASPEREFLAKLTMNVENTLAHFYEVLVRMEVEPYETAEGAAVDLKRHRALSVEPAMLPEHDGRIVRSLKQGFLWRERVIRPEEVVVCKWPGVREPAGE